MKTRSTMLLAVCLCLFTSAIYAQEVTKKPIYQRLEAAKAEGLKEAVLAPFEPATPLQTARKAKVESMVKDATYLQLSASVTQSIFRSKPQLARFVIPQRSGAPIELELVLQSVLDDNFYVTTSESGDLPVAYQPGAYYRGIVKGKPNSVVALSVFENEIMAVAATDEGNFVLGKISEPGNVSDYILYSDRNLPAPEGNFCGTIEPLDYTEKMRTYLQQGPQMKTTNALKCVKVFLECDYALYVNKGSNVTNTTNFITGAFNNVATIYANEQITTTVSQVHVWTSQDPYPTASSGDALNTFKATRTSFNGNLAHLCALGGQNVGGIAWVDVICNNAYRYAYSNIYSSYNAVPTYSWTIYVMTHEMGHNLGSPHTQSCSWTGGALDNCYTTEGGCAPGPAPTNGGTIMSYCHLTSAGINFNNGFGTQPGNLIRNRVNNATCLTACTTTTCQQPNNLTLRIVVDNYPGETTWNLKNSANTIIASGGPYSGTPSGTTINVPVCIPYGCYTLTFMDSYGDGICCSYGNGSYTLINNANNATIVSGGQFTTQDVKTFCLNAPVTYCGSAGSNTGYEYINRVQLNTINNLSGNNNGYFNYTSLSTTLTPGAAYTATLTPGFSSSAYTENWAVWIDYNKNGVFTDAGEQVLTLSGAAAVSGSFTVPGGVTGTTRMRVSMKFGGTPTSCEAFTYGEVEDYTVILGSPTPAALLPTGWNETGQPASFTVQSRTAGFAIYPNPATETVNIDWGASVASEASISVMDITGRRLIDVRITSREGANLHALSVRELPAGNYIVILQAGADRYQQKLTISK